MSADTRPPDAPSPERRYRFTPEQRLHTPPEYQAVYDGKQRAGDDHLLMFAARRAIPVTRIGLSIGKKQGNSVRRHHLKRLLREAFRLAQHDLPQGLDLVLIPRVGTTAGAAEFQESLVRLARRLDRRMAPLPASHADEHHTGNPPAQP